MINLAKKLLLFSPLIFLVYTPWTLYPAIFGRSLIFQVLIEVILLVLLIRAIRNKLIGRARLMDLIRRIRRISPLGLSLILFTFIQVLSLIFSIDRESSFWGSMSRMDGIWSWFHMLAFFFILSALFKNSENDKSEQKDYWTKFLLVNSSVAGVLSLAAIWQHWSALIPDYIIQSGRVYATFGNSVFFATYLIFAIFFTFFLITFTRPLKLARLIGVIGLVGLQITALILTDSQGAIGGFIGGLLAGIIFLAVGQIRRIGQIRRMGQRERLLAAIGFLILTGFIVFSLFRLNIFGIIKNGKLESIEGLEARSLVWKISLAAFKEKPLLGFGPANFEYAFDKYYNPELLKFSFYETVSSKPHNILVETLAHTGILGLLSYLLIFIASIFAIWKVRKKDIVFSGLAFGLLTAYFLNLQFAFDTTNSWFMWMVFLAILAKNTVSYQSPVPSRQDSAMAVPSSYKLWVLGTTWLYKISAIILLLVAISFILINISAWHASTFLARAQNKYWLEKPIIWANEVARALDAKTPYHDEIRVLAAQDLVSYEASGTLPVVEIVEQTKKFGEKLEESSKNHPENFQYPFMQGQVYTILAESLDASFIEKAKQVFESAVDKSPKRQAIYLMIGKTYFLEGNFEKAKEAINKAINLYPQAATPHWFLGVVKVGEGNLEEGRQDLLRARELGHSHEIPEIYYLIQLNKRMGQEEENEELRKLLDQKFKEAEKIKERAR